LGSQIKYDDQVTLLSLHNHQESVKEPNAIVSNSLDTFDLLAAFPSDLLRKGEYEPVYEELVTFV
jgi:hypothetical protein